MSYRYGEAFKRLGVPGMGHQGATWCGLNPSGVLVLMAHENYVHFRNGPRRYETPVHGIAPPRSPSGDVPPVVATGGGASTLRGQFVRVSVNLLGRPL
jgi:hypothetical protein